VICKNGPRNNRFFSTVLSSIFINPKNSKLRMLQPINYCYRTLKKFVEWITSFKGYKKNYTNREIKRRGLEEFKFIGPKKISIEVARLIKEEIEVFKQDLKKQKSPIIVGVEVDQKDIKQTLVEFRKVPIMLKSDNLKNI
jgi:hypothetical protein